MLRAVGLLSLGLFVVAAVPGQTPVEEIALDYSTVGDCPSMREFEEQVYARTQRVRFVSGHRSKRYFRVRLGLDSGFAVGRVTGGRGSEVGDAREVTSDSCGDVAAALALVVALAIDPQASVGSIPESATSPAQPAAPAVDRPPDTTAVVAQPGAPSADAQSGSNPDSLGAAAPANVQPWRATFPDTTTPGGPSANAHAGPAPRLPGAATLSREQAWHATFNPHEYDDEHSLNANPSPPVVLRVGARLSGAIWRVPTTVPIGATAMSLEGESTTSRLASGFRVSVAYAISSDVSAPVGAQVHFAIMSIQGEYCPIRLALTSGIHLRPCAGVSGGRLTGTGVTSRPDAQSWSKHRPWGSVDESVHLQFALGKGWQTSFEAGLSQPLWHDKYVFELAGQGNLTAATTPRLVPTLGLGVSARFF